MSDRDECEKCIMMGRCKDTYQPVEGRRDCCFGHWVDKFSCREICNNRDKCYEYTMAGSAVVIKEES